ncbi:MAG: hypothetical protein WBN20_11860 [Eudoraea sp.]|uniref:hypothetical protein n=1 Tax=Eudoraea sp. TaxID=1979955 RepID=UPI003C791AF8
MIASKVICKDVSILLDGIVLKGNLGIPKVNHLFEEPRKLQEVAEISAKWFRVHLLNEKI